MNSLINSLDKMIKNKMISNKDSSSIDVVASSFLISKLMASNGSKEVLEKLNTVLQMDPPANKSVRFQAIVVLGKLSSTDPSSLGYLSTLANAFLKETDKNVAVAAQQAIGSAIDAVIAKQEDEITNVAMEKLQAAMDSAIVTLENNDKNAVKLNAAIVFTGIASQLYREKNPALVKKALSALNNVFDRQRVLVAQSFAKVGPFAHPEAYDSLRNALFSCSTSERAVFVNAMQAIVEPPNKGCGRSSTSGN
jgi:hypothetical protein